VFLLPHYTSAERGESFRQPKPTLIIEVSPYLKDFCDR
jgi:hypothetical protein